VLRLRDPWTWALAAALVAAGEGCLLDTGPFAAGSTGAGGAGGEGGAGASTSAGAGPVCGNAKREEGEDCDDGNTVAGDGCFGCKMDCGCPGCVGGKPCPDCEPIEGSVLLEDPGSKHCYLFVPAASAHDAARAACEGWGAELVAPSTDEELKLLVDPELVAAFEPRAEPDLVWTGGVNEGTWQWENGEPWKAPSVGPSWGTDSPDPAEGTDCIVIDSGGKIRDRACDEEFPFMCERTPM
jgi:cysteine-rich repeat protein